GSYVGSLAKGVEVRALQMKLWIAGLQSVRAVTMGGGLILLHRCSGWKMAVVWWVTTYMWRTNFGKVKWVPLVLPAVRAR
ncbi:hypothetical protein A2U01_0086240, partial [Trifolium medium]|nr:hypothetical protein [Trifolium medium]